MTKNAITWIREDFRIEHNPALAYATQNHENVVALYIYNKTDFDNKREAQKWWLYKSLEVFQLELSKYKIIEWITAPAEKMPFTDNSFDYYTISFGLRNTKNLDLAVSEAYRVLKPGGRYLCLEFSKIQNTNINLIYKNYSKLIPIIGQFIVGEKEPYEYLVKSIEQFINQEELIDLMQKHKFQKCSYRNFSNGIVSIHSGWKI